MGRMPGTKQAVHGHMARCASQRRGSPPKGMVSGPLLQSC